MAIQHKNGKGRSATGQNLLTIRCQEILFNAGTCYRFVSNRIPWRVALAPFTNIVKTRCLDFAGSNVSDDVKMAYVSTVLQEQAQLMTVFQIGQYMTFFVLSLLVLTIFFGDKKSDSGPGWFRRLFGAAATTRPA